ncbi:MAG: M23 family metallopeptidase [Pedosphaera sp.]|nr:M23 family metallopeptidase [Pedosphaera sp.]
MISGQSLTNRKTLILVLLLLVQAATTSAQLFQLPTANRAIYEPDGGERFFVGTVGKPWSSGTFGCVRSDGWQIHEGLDIKCLQRDRSGEPADSVMASADGTVAYISTKPALSNYGKYIILKHRIVGLEIYTLYAHLSDVRSTLRIGQTVKAGETIATMGRTSNTRQRITKDRAHVHFEINLLVNERFAEWFQKTSPGERNDHGDWNGHNLLGLDPRLVLLAQREQGAGFSLLQFIRAQTDLCHVLVRDTHFPWLRRYTPLIRRNPTADREGIAGYEIVLNYMGAPYQLIPRAASELRGQSRVQLLSVNDAEQQKHPCRKLVVRRGAQWQLTDAGHRFIDLLTY